MFDVLCVVNESSEGIGSAVNILGSIGGMSNPGTGIGPTVIRTMTSSGSAHRKALKHEGVSTDLG